MKDSHKGILVLTVCSAPSATAVWQPISCQTEFKTLNPKNLNLLSVPPARLKYRMARLALTDLPAAKDSVKVWLGLRLGILDSGVRVWGLGLSLGRRFASTLLSDSTTLEGVTWGPS